jgi:hypothetical protein
MHWIHPVFHVVKLLPAPTDPIPRCRPPPPLDPEVVDGEMHYELDSILDGCLVCNKLQFLVSWRGYGYEDNSWVDDRDLDAPRLVKEFYNTHPGAPCQICAVCFGKLLFQPTCADTHPREGGNVRGPSNSSATQLCPPLYSTTPLYDL